MEMDGVSIGKRTVIPKINLYEEPEYSMRMEHLLRHDENHREWIRQYQQKTVFQGGEGIQLY